MGPPSKVDGAVQKRSLHSCSWSPEHLRVEFDEQVPPTGQKKPRRDFFTLPLGYAEPLVGLYHPFRENGDVFLKGKRVSL